jgi:hypothetical protein
MVARTELVYNRIRVLDGAGVLTTCNRLPRFFKNPKLDFSIQV